MSTRRCIRCSDISVLLDPCQAIPTTAQSDRANSASSTNRYVDREKPIDRAHQPQRGTGQHDHALDIPPPDHYWQPADSDPDHTLHCEEPDIGRKYFSAAWIKQFIVELSWLKLNVLHLHLNDNTGIRLECTTHPEIVSDPHLSKVELAEILAVAAAHSVTLLPEFDTPSHAEALIANHSWLQLVDCDGIVHPDKIDFSKEAARHLVADIVREWAEMFPGPWFHVGGDEFFGLPGESDEAQSLEKYPQLRHYAAETTSTAASAIDGFVLYMNELNGILKQHGKHMRMWNDHVDPRYGGLQIDTDVELDVWIRWNEDAASARDYLEGGYPIVNRNGDYLYFILSADEPLAESGRKSPQGIYELWNPHRFMGAAGGAADLDIDHTQPVAGAVMSIWCDAPDIMTEDEIGEKVLDWMRAFAQQAWGSDQLTKTFAEFKILFRAVSTSPAVGCNQPSGLGARMSGEGSPSGAGGRSAEKSAATP